MSAKTKALVVLSGGQDSTCCLAIAKLRSEHSEVVAITFDYNQRHRIELDAARTVARLMGITNHSVLAIGPILQGTSPLTDPGEQLEQYKDFASMEKIIGDRVEKTFVPMRNSLFLTLAANRAVCMGATVIYTGVCQADNANYPDCRATFISAQEEAINQALGFEVLDPRRIRIFTPLMHQSKADAIRESVRLGYYHFLAYTHTAYDGQYPPIGNDHATVLRAQGFLEADVPDPLVVRAAMEGRMPLPATPNYRGPLVHKVEKVLVSLAKRVAEDA